MAHMFFHYLNDLFYAQVLKLAAKRRLVDRTLINSIQTALHGYYGDRIIALGGTFVMESGKASVHVMVSTDSAICFFTILFTADCQFVVL